MTEQVAINYEPIRYCEKCGSASLGLIVYNGDFWRKECMTCGSTGPFPLVKPHA
jgi:hypothetical protein